MIESGIQNGSGTVIYDAMSAAIQNETIRSTPGAAAGLDSLWRLSKAEYRAGAAALVLLLIARWLAFLPGYAIDDYVLVHGAVSSDLGTAIASGRALTHLLRVLLVFFGADPPRAGILAVLALTLALVYVGIVTARLWGLRDRFAETLIATCFIGLFPYQVEIFTFRTAALFLAIPLAISFPAVLLCGHSRRYWFAAVALIFCAFSIYQSFLNYLALALLFSVVFHLARGSDADPGFWRALRSRVLAVAAALAIYVTAVLIAASATGFALNARGTLLPLAEVGTRAAAALALWKKIFLQYEPVLPLAPKLLMLATVGVAAACQAFVAFRSGRLRSFARTCAAGALAILCGVPLCAGLVLALREWWPVPRVIAQTGVFWGGIFALAYYSFAAVPRRILAAGTCLIFLSFIGINNQVLADQLRVNMRDFAKANRILARVEALPEFPQLKGVAITGGFWAYPSPIRTVEGDMNVSALYVSYARIGLLKELSGYAFEVPPPDVSAAAAAYCGSAPKWPAAGSVSVVNRFAVVCLAAE